MTTREGVTELGLSFSHRLDNGEKGKGRGQLDDPKGVVANSKEIFIADRNNRRICVFSWDGKPLRAFGTSGYRMIDVPTFCNPMGLCLSDDGKELYITDQYGIAVCQAHPPHNILRSWTPTALLGRFPYAIQMFHQLVIYSCGVRVIDRAGEQGEQPGSIFCSTTDGSPVPHPELSSIKVTQPVGLALSHRNVLWISDDKKNKVVGSNGVSFGSRGREVGQFDTPCGIACCGDVLAVVDANNYRVQLFDTQRLKVIGKLNLEGERFGRPYGVAFAGKTRLVVTTNLGAFVFSIRSFYSSILFSHFLSACLLSIRCFAAFTLERARRALCFKCTLPSAR